MKQVCVTATLTVFCHIQEGEYAAVFGINSKRRVLFGLDNLPARCCQVQELSLHVTLSHLRQVSEGKEDTVSK